MTECLAEVQCLVTTVCTWSSCVKSEDLEVPMAMCAHWAVSEVSGALCVLLIESQSVEEIPGITSWGTALPHPPKPQCGQKDIGSCDLPHHCQGRWDSSANAKNSLPASKPTAMESLEMPLGAVHGTSTQRGSQTLSPGAEANSCPASSHPSISEKGCGRSCFLLCCDNLPRTALGRFQLCPRNSP